MFAFAELELDGLRDQPWAEILPWLDSYESAAAADVEAIVPAVADWWIADSPRDTARDAPLDVVVTGLSALIVRGHRSSALCVLAPFLDVSIPLAALYLSPRAETVVRRLGARDFVRILLSCDVDSLFAIRGTSLESVEDIVAGVIGAAVREDPAAGVSEAEDSNPAAIALIDDLRVLARWRRLRARDNVSLVEVQIEDDAPERVQEVAARIAALTGSDFDALVESNPIDEIENLVEQLDERGTLVLREHLMAQKPISMGELSSRLHVSKSRAGSLVAQVKQDLMQACAYETAAGGLMASMRLEIRPVTPLENLMRMHPILAEEVPSLQVPLWLALDRIDDAFEVTGRWAAAPDVRAAKATTIMMLEQLESVNGVVALEQAAELLHMTPEDTRQWCDFSEIPVMDDHVLLSTRKLIDHVAGALEVKGEPLTTQDLINLLDCDRSPASIERELGAADRLVHEDQQRWRLAPVDAINGGMKRVTKELRQTRRLYRLDIVWTFRVQISADHLRGAGLTIPAGVAEAFGCRQGTVRELSSYLGPQVLRWTGKSPTCSSIRRFLVDLECVSKDAVLLTYSDDGGFGVRRCAETPEGDPLREALALVGCPDPSSVADDEIAPMLARAVGLSADAKPRRILSTYQSRDEQVAELLESRWVVSPQ